MLFPLQVSGVSEELRACHQKLRGLDSSLQQALRDAGGHSRYSCKVDCRVNGLSNAGLACKGRCLPRQGLPRICEPQ